MTGGDSWAPGVFVTSATVTTARMANSEQAMTRLGGILRGLVALLVSLLIS